MLDDGSMSITRLRHLASVAQTGSMRESARLLGIHPAALSRSIHGLERELGIGLVVPHGRGIRVTDAGMELADEATHAVQAYDRFHDRAGDVAQDAPAELRIASFETFTTYVLGDLAAGALAAHAVRVVAMRPGEVEGAVAGGDADIGITIAPASTTDATHVEVGSMRLATFAHPDLAARAATPDGVLPFAAPGHAVQSSLAAQRAADGWPDGEHRVVRYRINALETAFEVARRGLAAVYAPDVVVRLHNESTVAERRLVEVTGEPWESCAREATIWLVTRPDDAGNPLTHRVLGALARLTTD
ncbi:MAG: hypothetical protein JWM98_3378 [Thermoleophilia bacterium]|nr:hypothetical protein [Thermoleophilia bacterium]